MSVVEKCMEMRVSFKFDLNKICFKNDIIDKMRYWFGFGMLEYIEEFFKNNGKKNVCIKINFIQELYLQGKIS